MCLNNQGPYSCPCTLQTQQSLRPPLCAPLPSKPLYYIDYLPFRHCLPLGPLCLQKHQPRPLLHCIHNINPCCVALSAADTPPAEATAVRPTTFKSLVGRGHPEFSTGRQQDVAEYLLHLLDQVCESTWYVAISNCSCRVNRFRWGMQSDVAEYLLHLLDQVSSPACG
jgi:hypothetical protein